MSSEKNVEKGNDALQQVEVMGMDKKKTSSGTVYYLIDQYSLGKEKAGKYYLYQNGTWEPDTESRIMDHKVGFDASEPEDSPYRFGNGSVMDEMREISESEAISFIREEAIL